jgi:hypothetical protein
MPSIGGTRGVSAASSPSAPPPPTAGYPKGSEEGGVVGTWKEGASGLSACCAAKGRGSTTSPTEDPDVARTAAHDMCVKCVCSEIAALNHFGSTLVPCRADAPCSAFHLHFLSQ